MRPSIIELREFYATPRGRMAARTIAQALCRMRDAAPPAPNQAEVPLLAYGYAIPVLAGAPATARHLMPQAQGYQAWPPTTMAETDTRTSLCQDEAWPLPDESAGAILIMHALEHSADPFALLAEAWRVLAPHGQLWLIVPNRRSLWSQADATPFGRGQPYSARQLRDLLHAACFVPESWRRALYAPPAKSRLLLATAPLLEWIMPWIAPVSGGAILLRAVKQIHAPVGFSDPHAIKSRDFRFKFPNAIAAY